ncbi:MAG: amidohydrolase family protein [Eudoraea sp.]|nr:amidohydrolase family protein [Eudoraea sp.]
MSKRFLLSALIGVGWFSLVLGQEYFPKNDGVKTPKNNYTAFTNATIHVSPEKVLQNATLLIQKDKVIAVGNAVTIPKNTVTVNLAGKSIYPSFIDAFSDFGVTKPKRTTGGGRSAQYDASREGYYWNDHIMPENSAISKFKYDAKKAKELQKAGFGTVNTHIHDGIARGTGLLVALNSEGSDGERILDDQSAQYFSFNKSVAKRQSYPTSLMGAMALLRQMYHDASWYAKGNSNTRDRSLEALNANSKLVQIFEAGDKGHVLRADGIGDAFGIQYTLLAGGDEYENIEDIKGTNARLIVPLNFPDPYDVSNPYQAGYIALKDMRHWNQAPTNPKVLAENGVTFSFTLHQLKSPSKFKEQLIKAIRYGLSSEKALAALTTVPAQILGKENQLGTLDPGKQANFLITSGELFEKNTTLYENWVQGRKYVINDLGQKDIRGEYDLVAGGITYKWSVTGEASKPKSEIKRDTLKYKSKFSFKEDWLELSFTNPEGEDRHRMTARVSPDEDDIRGRLILPNGIEASFNARKTAAADTAKKDNGEMSSPEVVPMTYPNVGYGYRNKPAQEDLLFKNATVWTSEEAGILENTDVLVKKGKITKIGQNLSAGGARVIDASGKHLTAGVIDEHSHIAALAVNEAGHNSTAEVKMTDVVDPEDVDIYRNLAGGVTSLQLLHGSANPIGGRSAVLKLKWGESASDMIYSNGPKFIKFALGENVKQSNWQSFDRFPQTRMGVEQVFTDYFQRAREYDIKKKSGQAYRYDEEMEVLAEILNGERFISCHSYVQSEINMMMKVAEKFGFTLNTFTHILEGYKVADKMAAHGAGGSTFSDWWAYKYEVKDAIPYNAAIMVKQGVTVAINSDDAEMSRRLNQEAGKTLKYGGLSEEEAWKMVTINPAKLLHIDDRVGSIKEGKDADLVLWNTHPMSVYAKAEKTIIEGTTYFDLEKDQTQRKAIANERNRLIQMMLKEKEGGANTRKPAQLKKEKFHCDSL